MTSELLPLLLSLGYRLIKILVAFFLLFAVLRAFDHITQKRFNLFDVVDNSAMAAATYYGLRFLGSAYLVATVWGV